MRSTGDIMEQSTNRAIAFGVADSAKLLADIPSATLTFKTSAMGDLIDVPESKPEADILFPVRFIGGRHSGALGKAFNQLKFAAVQMGREVTHYRDGENYFIKFGPVRS